MKIVNTLLIDGFEYVIVKRINNYVFLAQVDDPENVIIQKIVKDGIDEKMIPLDSEEEFDKALLMFKEEEEKN